VDVFLLCFSLASPHSYANVHHKWIPELHHHAPGVPIVLVGTKMDARDGDRKKRFSDQPLHVDGYTGGRWEMPQQQALSHAGDGSRHSLSGAVVTYGQGLKLMKDIGAQAYFECSARKFQKVNEVFAHAARLVLRPPTRMQARRKRCFIM